jgi:hypothetical protein
MTPHEVFRMIRQTLPRRGPDGRARQRVASPGESSWANSCALDWAAITIVGIVGNGLREGNGLRA